MPILQLPTRPPRDAEPGPESDPALNQEQPSATVRVRAGQHGEFEEHELIYLLDSIDDERAKARFRESVYISIIIWLAVVWFLFYGPHILFHQPYYKDPIALMKQHDKELTYIAPSAPPPRIAPKIDRKTMEALKQQALQRQLQTPPTPQPPQLQPQPPQPQQEAHNVAPPVPQPQLPLPAVPRAPSAPAANVPNAPAPNFARNESAQSALQNAMRGAIATRGSGITAPGSSAGPLKAGFQTLSDTQGVDFNEYMRRLHDIVQHNWEPLIPEEVNPPIAKRGIVGIRFSILPDGQIGDMKLETTSGDVALDKAAWYAITSSGQLPPLPKQFHGPDLELRVGFFYNQPVE